MGSAKTQLANLLEVLRDEGPACGTNQSYQRKERVFSEGEAPDGYTLVQSGRVKLVCARASGRETILEIVGPGELVCSGAVWSRQAYCCNAVAEDEFVEVTHIPRTTIEEAVEDWPAPARSLLDASAERSVAMCRRVTETTSGRVDRRIAATILRLAERGRRLDEGGVLTGRLSRQDIADLCGTTLESAIRTMRGFEKKGWIESTDEGIVIREAGPLRALAETG